MTSNILAFDIGEVFASNAGILFTVLLTVVLTLFSKMIISIFKYGVNYSKDVVSKIEFEAFKREIRADMAAYKDELTSVVMNSAVRIIDEKLKDLQDVKTAAIDIRVFENQLKNDLKQLSMQYNDITKYSDRLRVMEVKVARIEGNQSVDGGVRRKVDD